MIIKILGMCLVFLSSCAIGYALGECYVSREKELRNIYEAIELMEGELSYTLLPVKNLIANASCRAKGITGDMFKLLSERLEEGTSPGEAWQYALEKKGPSMALKKSDCDSLTSLSYLFEAYELEEQQNHFEAFKLRLTQLINDAAESRKKNLRLVRLLGVYGGALICIIMF